MAQKFIGRCFRSKKGSRVEGFHKEKIVKSFSSATTGADPAWPHEQALVTVGVGGADNRAERGRDARDGRDGRVGRRRAARRARVARPRPC